jgi:hypothetical protein
MKKKSELQIAFNELISSIRIYQICSRPVYTPHDPKSFSQSLKPPLGIHRPAERSRDVSARA